MLVFIPPAVIKRKKSKLMLMLKGNSWNSSIIAKIVTPHKQAYVDCLRLNR
jgi:hypothetical protein